MSRPISRQHLSTQPDGRGPAQLHPRWAYSGRILPPQSGQEGVHHATNPLESAGSAEMTLIGDVSDSSGTYTTPRAVLCSPRQVQQPNVGAARGQCSRPCQLGVFLVPAGFREAAAMASRLTPSPRRNGSKKKQSTTLLPATPFW